MAAHPHVNQRCLARVGVISALVVASVVAASAADHGDTPLLTRLGRSDAKLTDLHAFVHDGALVLALSTNPAVPTSAVSYTFPSDLELSLLIDAHSQVSFGDPEATAVYGGTVVDPAGISADVVARIRFKRNGKPKLDIDGFSGRYKAGLQLFAGLRDDPFIRGPREGRNVGSIVIELSLAGILREQSTILVWAVSKVEGINGPFQDMAGRALRSMFTENDLMNTTPPSQHFAAMGVAPDVIILDTARPTMFPNGRALTDDVVDLVGDPRITSTDSPFPTVNDRPFLDAFPYLAAPHPPH